MNYFEYVCSAYQNEAVNKEIVDNSFRTTMVRFYMMVGTFLLNEIAETGRNPWMPFSLYVEMQADSFKCVDGDNSCESLGRCRRHIASSAVTKAEAIIAIRERSEEETQSDTRGH